MKWIESAWRDEWGIFVKQNVSSNLSPERMEAVQAALPPKTTVKKADLENEGGGLWVIPCCFPLGHNLIICAHTHTHTQTKTYTHTSSPQPPAQMWISTAVFLWVSVSFMMMLRRPNQTLLQCEPRGAHTNTDVPPPIFISCECMYGCVCVCVCS